MSSDIYAKPALFTKVRYNREAQEVRGEWQQREVDIYESADDIRDADFQSQEGRPHNKKHPTVVQRRCFIAAAAFSLGVLYLLILTAFIILSIQHISVTSEKDQLQSRYNKLSHNYSRLQETVSDMEANSSQLQSSYETLSEVHSQLQDEVKKLQGNREVKCCPEGWTRFGCSCYVKSTKKKTWHESSSDCQNKGAHLVVIHTKEEQNFVTELSMSGESWIGLWEKWTIGLIWEWVDGSPLTQRFWASELPQHIWNKHTAAACCNQQGRWMQRDKQNKKYWICEKESSCTL